MSEALLSPPPANRIAWPETLFITYPNQGTHHLCACASMAHRHSFLLPLRSSQTLRAVALALKKKRTTKSKRIPPLEGEAAKIPSFTMAGTTPGKGRFIAHSSKRPGRAESWCARQHLPTTTGAAGSKQASMPCRGCCPPSPRPDHHTFGPLPPVLPACSPHPT